ncbi:MAG: YncE family protein [bacterium]
MRAVRFGLALLLAVSGIILTCRKWDNPLDPTDNQPPDLPTQPLPDSGAVGQDTGITLGWVCADPDSFDTLSYIIYVGTEPAPPMRDSGLAEARYKPTGLAWQTRYYWRVTALDNRGGRTEGAVWNFTVAALNHPPAAPNSPVPESGATELSVRPVLRWRASDPDPGDSLEFDLYIGTANPPPPVESGLADTFYSPAGLKYDSTYYWRVVCRDQRGAETSGPVWRFRTMTRMTVDAPLTGERLRMLSAYVIRWSGGPRPGVSGGRPQRRSPGAARVDAVDSSVVFYSTNGGSSWVRLGRPTVGGQYSWQVPGTATTAARVQVRAFAAGDTMLGNTGNFTIYDTLPPSALTVTAPVAWSRWTLGGSYHVTWTGGTDGMDSCVVFYSTNAGASWLRQGSTKQAGRFIWTLLGPASAQARVRVVAHCRADTSAGVSDVFQTLESPYPDSLLATLAVGAGPVALCYDSIDQRVFCANHDSASISIISGQSNTVIATIPVGPAPNALIWTPISNKVYCTTDSGKVVAVRGATNAVARTLDVGRRPVALCWNRLQNRVYVANAGDSTVSVIDCATDSVIASVVVRQGPRALAWNPNTNRVYVSDSSPAVVSVIDCASNQVVADVAVSSSPYALLVDEPNNIVWAAGRSGNALCPIDGATNQPLSPVTVGREPWALAWNAARGRIYSLNSADNNISIVDAGTRQVVLGLPVGNQPRSAAFARTAGKLYVVNYAANSVTIVDGVRDQIVRFLGVDRGPVAVCWNSGSNKIYTANSTAGTVSIIVPRGSR